MVLSIRSTLILCLLGLAITLNTLPEHPPWVLLPPWRINGVLDATAFRGGAELVGTPGLYDMESVAAVQERNVGTRDALRFFIRLPWYAIAVKWMAWVPYPTAMTLWKILIVLAGGLFILVWPGDQKLAALALCWSIPAVAGFEQGQDTVFVLVCFAAALRLLCSWPVISGLVLSLCVAKFHFLLFFPIFALVSRSWRLLTGFLSGTLLLLVASTMLQGGGWFLEYFDLLSSLHFEELWWITPSITGLLRYLPYFPITQIIITLLVGVCVWRICIMQSAELALSASLAAGVIVATHAYPQDVILLIPLGLFSIRALPRAWWLSIILLSPLATYPLVLWIPLIGTICVLFPSLALLFLLQSHKAVQRPLLLDKDKLFYGRVK